MAKDGPYGETEELFGGFFLVELNRAVAVAIASGLSKAGALDCD